MSSIQDILNSIQSLEKDADNALRSLRTQRVNLEETLSRTQKHFSDQPEGKAISAGLSKACSQIQSACCEVEQLKAALNEYSRQISS